MLDFKQYQRLFCWVRKPPAWTVGVKAFDLERAPSFNAGTNSLRKEKGVCGKNLCGFFLRDFNQPAAAPRLCRWQRRGSPKRETGNACLSFWRGRRDLNPRAGFIQPTPLAGEPLRPLGYFRVSGCRFEFWRREWDSNPRALARRRFSRPVPSTTRTSLHRKAPSLEHG